MAKKNVESEPTEEDRELLRVLKHDSLLGQAHPCVVQNVIEAACKLLVHLGRPKLADVLVQT